MPPKRTSRRLRGYPPESQERVQVGSADEEVLPPPGSARVDCHFDSADKCFLTNDVVQLFYPCKDAYCKCNVLAGK